MNEIKEKEVLELNSHQKAIKTNSVKEAKLIQTEIMYIFKSILLISLILFTGLLISSIF